MTTTRRLAAILAADVAGYSRLMGADEEGTLAALRTIRRELGDPKIAEHRGRIVKTTGDGLLVEFASVVDALRCAVEIQRAMTARNAGVSQDRRIEFRIGIHQGDIVVEDGDIFGDGVNVAARLEGLAEAGGICVSARVQEDAAGKLDLVFEDIGEQSLKNIARPVRVYRVALPHAGADAPRSPLSRIAGEGAERRRREAGAGLTLPDKPSLAVLPFQNLSGDPEQEYFADGMVEEIITALSRIRWLFVIARNSSFTYKGRAVDVKQVARELGVRYVLEGSVRKGGNRVRITGQLIDTSTSAHIWADRFDGLLDDIFELQDQVASNVAGVIEPTLRKAEFERVSRKPTESLDAYDLYLRALALRYQYTEESVREAISLLERALAIDPSYAPAAAMIGSFRLHQRGNRLGEVSDAEVAEAVRLAREVIEKGRDDPDAIRMAASTLLFFTGDVATAGNLVDHALALNPNSAHAWQSRAAISLARNQPNRAIEALEHATRLSPLDPWGGRTFTVLMAMAHLDAGRFEQAIEWADRSLSAQPNYRPALLTKVISCVCVDRIDEAQGWVRQLLQFDPGVTIAGLRSMMPVTQPELLARYAERLRTAGLPE